MHSYKTLDIKMMFAMATITLILFAAVLQSYAVMNLSAEPSPQNPDTQVKLEWASVANSVYYNVFRGETKLTAIDVSKDKNYLRYIDTSLSPSTAYLYIVNATDASGRVLDSDSSSVATSQMQKPVITSSKYDINTSDITLTWSLNSLAAARSSIVRSDGSMMASINNTNTSFSFSGIGLAYYQPMQYMVMTLDNKANFSPNSNPVNVVPIPAPVISASMRNNTVKVSWAEHAKIELFRLERARYAGNVWGPWQVIHTQIPKGAQSVEDVIPSEGVYRYRLNITNYNYTGCSNISNPISKPAAPTNLQCSLSSAGKIKLSWTNDENNISSLRIERKSESEDYSAVAVIESSEDSYIDTLDIVPDSAYTYRIIAFDTNNNSAASLESSISTGMPSAPSPLGVNIISSDKVQLIWSDNSNNELGCSIERKTDISAFIEIASAVPPDTTTYLDTDLDTTHTYTYRVRAYNPTGYSDYSNDVLCSTSVTANPPGSLTVSPASSSQMNLDWTYSDSDKNRIGTAIERAEGNSGKWKQVAKVEGDTTNFTDTGLTPNHQYFYRVKAVVSSSIYSSTYPNDSLGKGAYTLLKNPESLEGQWSSSSEITLSWTDTLSESQYIIERKSDDGTYETAGFIKANITTWVDNQVNPLNRYTYRIKTVSLTNHSDYSNEVVIDSVNIPPPAELQYICDSNSQVTLRWKDGSGGKCSFIIERKDEKQEQWSEIASLVPGTESHSDKNLVMKKQYLYRIKAFEELTQISAYSAILEVFIEEIPAASDLKVSVTPSAQAILTWKDNSENEEGFVIERKFNTESYTEIARVGTNIKRYVDTGLLQSTQYFYRVRALSPGKFSDYSNEEFVITADPPEFSDMPYTHWARAAVTDLAGKGIIKGKSSMKNIFAPNDKITRAEFISMIIKALNLKKSPIGSFTDVKPGVWYYGDVMSAKIQGIVTGTGNNYFYPKRPVTREEMAVILAKSLKAANNSFLSHDTSILSKYSDRNSISPYALSGIASLIGEGIMNGKSETRLAPKDYATRAEAAAIIYNALNGYKGNE